MALRGNTVEHGHMAGECYGGKYGFGIQCIGTHPHHFRGKGIAAIQKAIGPHAINGDQDHFFYGYHS